MAFLVKSRIVELVTVLKRSVRDCLQCYSALIITFPDTRVGNQAQDVVSALSMSEAIARVRR